MEFSRLAEEHAAVQSWIKCYYSTTSAHGRRPNAVCCVGSRQTISASTTVYMDSVSTTARLVGSVRGAWRLIRDTMALPLFDLNYLTSVEALGLYSYNPNFPRRGILGCAAVFAYKALRSLPESLMRDPVEPNRTRIFFAVETKNQTDAIHPIAERLDACSTIALERECPGARFPMALAYVVAFMFWPVCVFRYFQASEYQKRAFAHVFHQYLLTYGLYLVARVWLRHHEPRLVVVANDHNMKTRTLAAAGRDEDVRTAYVQHASISGRFPPLMFDVALLDGIDAATKYADIGSHGTEAYLVGIPKFDAYAGRTNSSERVSSLGVCVNVLDPADRVASLCAHLRETFPNLELVFRPHPGDARDWPGLLRTIDVGLSDSKREGSFEYLSRVDAIISGDSNIILEAVLMNVVALYFDFGNRKTDHYGFVGAGLAPYFEREPHIVEAVARLMEKRPNVRLRAAPYCATVGTSAEGRSAELAADVLSHVARGTGVSGAWRPLPEFTAMPVYRFDG